MRVSYLALFLLVGTELGRPPSLPVDLWEDVTESTIGVNSYWTNMVELADVNEDGLVDGLSAIGAGNDDPQPPEFTASTSTRIQGRSSGKRRRRSSDRALSASRASSRFAT